MVARRVVQVVAVTLLLVVSSCVGAAGRNRPLEGTVDLLLGLPVRPFAIAHRGFGENPGTDPSRPIENTVGAVRKGFMAGASVVEVDVQLTRDRAVVALHDDVLADFTCVDQLTLTELQAQLPHVPTLQEIREEARRFNRGAGPLSGLVIVELKVPTPLCDPEDRQERAIVAAVTRVIARILAVSGLQFLTEEEIEQALGEPVTLIDKRLDLGLQWAEMGRLFRLPGYRSFGEVADIAALTEARVVEADLLLLHSAGAPLVQGLQATGLKVLDWKFLESLGVDGIYTNDVRLGVKRQATIP